MHELPENSALVNVHGLSARQLSGVSCQHTAATRALPTLPACREPNRVSWRIVHVRCIRTRPSDREQWSHRGGVNATGRGRAVTARTDFGIGPHGATAVLTALCATGTGTVRIGNHLRVSAPDRHESRRIKRRPKAHDLLMKARSAFKREAVPRLMKAHVPLIPDPIDSSTCTATSCRHSNAIRSRHRFTGVF